MTYIIQGKLEYEIETDGKDEAVKKGTEKFTELEKLGVKISEARIVDKASGFFLS